jgi:tetratricopeptide (TPR) repeat protein
MLEDLKELQPLIRQIESERWNVWFYGIYGVTLHLLSKYKDAREYLQIACDLARKSDTKDKSPLGSHLYNLACCLAMMEEKEEALTTLDKALAISPSLRCQARADGKAIGDFSGLAKAPRFEAILSKYAKT